MDERFRLDPDVIARGLAHTRQLRAQFRAGSTRTAPPAVGEPGEGDRFDPDRIAAEMAVGDERDQLRARVAQLEGGRVPGDGLIENRPQVHPPSSSSPANISASASALIARRTTSRLRSP